MLAFTMRCGHFGSLCRILESLDANPIFFFNDTATTEIYTLSLHDALPISPGDYDYRGIAFSRDSNNLYFTRRDRKSTRLNSSHITSSYAVFCLKKKKAALMTALYDEHAAVLWRYALRLTDDASHAEHVAQE